jgi:hypothetical protein
MKNQDGGDGSLARNLIGRRQMLKAAAAGIGVAMLPSVVLAAAAQKSTLAPMVAMGYWQHPRTVNLNTPDDVVADASSVTATAASYKLHVLAAVTNTALAVDAEYMGNAAHRFWQSWTEGGLLQQSPSTAIRWWAQNKRALPLTISTSGGASITQVPAQSGTYVLLIGPNAQPLPAWSTLALHETKKGNPRSLQLVSRGNSQRVPFPYLIFGVEQVV